MSVEKIKSWNQKTEALLTLWKKRTRESQHSHFEAGKFYNRMSYMFSIPVIIISTGISGFALVFLGKPIDEKTLIYFSIGGIVTALLTAIQTHFNFSKKAERHSSLGARYGHVRRELELLISLEDNVRGNAPDVLKSLKEKLDSLSAEGSVVPRRIHNKALSRLVQKENLKAKD